MKIPFLTLIKKKPNKPVVIQNPDLVGVPTKENIREIIDSINRDKKRKQLWDSLSTKKKAEVITHILERGLTNDAKTKK